MKKILLSTITLLVGCFSYAQVPVLYYDFEVNSARGTYENAVEQAVNSGNSALTTNGVTNFGGLANADASSFYSGTGNGIGIGANGWSKVTTDPGTGATQYFQFSANTEGLYGLALEFNCQKALNNAPNKLGVLWSKDGINFFPAATSDNATLTKWKTFAFAFGEGANNQSKITIRIYAYDAGAASPFLYIDNVTLKATAVSGVKSLLDYTAYATSLGSGKKYKAIFTDLAISGSGSVVYLNSPLPYSGTLSVGAGATLSVGTMGAVSDTTGSSTDSRVSGGTLLLEDGSTLQLSSTDSKSALKATLGVSLLKLNPNAAIEYIGSAPQYQDAATLANVIVSNPNGVVQTGDVVIGGHLTLKNGTMKPGANKLTIKGNVTKASGTIDAASAEVVLEGSAAQSVAAGVFSGPIKKLNINNPSGVSFDTDATITEAVNLTSGRLNIGTKKLTLRGALSRNGSTELGSIDAENGSLEFDGAVAQALPAGALHNNKVKNLRVTNTSADGVSLGGRTELSGVLDFGAVSNAKLKSNGHLTLKSDALGTARVADLTSGGVNTGNTIEGLVTVERYFANTGRRYRLVTPGVNTTTSIQANWQEGAMNTSFCATCNQNPVPGYGTHITGAGGNTNGFDASGTNNASLFAYNQATGAWVAVTNTSTTTLSASKPYLIFLRGDRSVDMTLTGAASTLPGTSTTLRATGTLATGEQTAPSLGSNGAFSLISNPFASPVSWTKIHGNNSKFEEYYTYWDPTVGPRGAYVTVTTSGLKSHATVAATTEIQSGQAFFVKTKTGVSSPALSIREQDKSTTSNIAVMRTASQVEQLGISLFYTDARNQRTLADGVTAAYGEHFSAAVDARDAVQMASWDEDIAIVRGGKSLSIETRPLIRANDTVYLSMARLKVQSYELQFDATDFNAPGLTAYLVDKFTGRETLISTAGTTVVPFAVTSNTASAAASRFSVVFKTAATLPLTFTAVRAAEATGGIRVEWTTASESAVAGFEVERSADGLGFAAIATTKANGQAQNHYSSLDRSPLKGANYYRIKAVDLNGDVRYSQVVVVKSGQEQEGVALYPNPVVGSEVYVQLTNLPKGSYTLCLLNSAGVRVHTQSLVHSGGTTTTESFSLPQQLPKGTYLLELKGSSIEKTLPLVRN